MESNFVAFLLMLGAIIIILAILYGIVWLLFKVCGIVDDLMKQSLKLSERTEERNRRRELLTSSEMILGGHVPGYRATSADE